MLQFYWKTTPRFSTLENTPRLEAECMELVGPYRSTVMNEMQGESDEDDDDSYNLRCFDGPSCIEEELMAEAESITGLFGSLNMDDDQNAESYLTRKNEIVKWLQDLNIQEESIGKLQIVTLLLYCST